MIPKKLLVFTWLLFSFSFSFSQSFTISDVDLNLRKNANAIVKYDDYSIKLVRQDKMLIHRKVAIEVLNKKADHLAELTLSYDKSNLIKSVYMEFYDASGKSTKKVYKKDFDDYSATDGGTLYSDNRVIHYNHTAVSYPYTVVYEYEQIWKYTASIPRWVAVNNYSVGVKSSTYTFSYPDDYIIQKIESNFESFDVKKIESTGLLQYSIKNFPAIKYESLSPSFIKQIPNVKLASNKFHLAGVDGEADNWQDFGKWMFDNFLATRNNLPTTTIAKVKEMVKGVEDPVERAKIVYEYVQNKTRYINVSVGIGGWQPMMTADVDKLSYGDCKALTFYTKSLMDVAEVPTIYTAVHSSNEKINIKKDLVSLQGNHVFLCLPREKDSIWLECTSQKLPFGYINASTDDRGVVLITPDGGKIVHTDTNASEDNLQESLAAYKIDENGTIQGSAEIYSYGTQYKNHLFQFDGLSPSNLEKSMKEYFDHINNLSFSKIEIANNKQEKHFLKNLEFVAENFAIVNADGTIIFNLNALNRNTFVPDRERNRKTSFEILRGYMDTDINTIEIPETYELSELPEDISIESQFGTYSVSIEKLSDNSLQYNRELLINKGLYAKELYEEYRVFRKKIRREENIKIAITKK